MIEAEDAINDTDRLLVQLTSMGHSDGLFNLVGKIYRKYCWDIIKKKRTALD